MAHCAVTGVCWLPSGQGEYICPKPPPPVIPSGCTLASVAFRPAHLTCPPFPLSSARLHTDVQQRPLSPTPPPGLSTPPPCLNLYSGQHHPAQLPFSASILLAPPTQMSNDVRILLPTMVAIMLAKFVADSASHSLYHGLLEVKCVPFLPKEVRIEGATGRGGGGAGAVYCTHERKARMRIEGKGWLWFGGR